MKNDRNKKKPLKPKKGHFALECKNERRKKEDDEKSRDKNEKHCVKRAPNDDASGKEDTCRQIQELMAVNQSEVWLTDSGASRHLSTRMVDRLPSKHQDTIGLGDNGERDVIGEGTVIINPSIIHGVL